MASRTRQSYLGSSELIKELLDDFTSHREIHTAATLRRGNSCIAVYGTPKEAGESCMQATQGPDYLGASCILVITCVS